VFILVISIAFFYLYLTIVYPIEEPKEPQIVTAQPKK
jgi:hypothetical protein